MASQVMRITLKAYDHQLVDASAKKIIETVKKNGSQVSGPVPLPTKKEVVTILRAVHKYKDLPKKSRLLFVLLTSVRQAVTVHSPVCVVRNSHVVSYFSLVVISNQL